MEMAMEHWMVWVWRVWKRIFFLFLIFDEFGLQPIGGWIQTSERANERAKKTAQKTEKKNIKNTPGL